MTETGKTCQRWDVNTPHVVHPDVAEKLLIYEDSLTDAQNYCRNPNEADRPWCYTTDPNERWEYCALKECGKSIRVYCQRIFESYLV